jgi:hypothetical protein
MYLLPVPQNRQLFRRVKPVLAILPDGQPTAEAVDEFIHCSSVGQVLPASIEDGGICILNGDGVFFGILKIVPRQGFSKIGGDFTRFLAAEFDVDKKMQPVVRFTIQRSRDSINRNSFFSHMVILFLFGSPSKAWMELYRQDAA